MIPDAIKAEVTRLNKAGVQLSVFDVGGQCYVKVAGQSAESPPWDRSIYEILIAVPVTYDEAGLDGFYLLEPHKFNSTCHPRVNGQTITVDGRTWRQVSWHYANGHEWQTGVDNLESHIAHSHGFFSGRGAANDP